MAERIKINGFDTRFEKIEPVDGVELGQCTTDGVTEIYAMKDGMFVIGAGDTKDKALSSAFSSLEHQKKKHPQPTAKDPRPANTSRQRTFAEIEKAKSIYLKNNPNGFV